MELVKIPRRRLARVWLRLKYISSEQGCRRTIEPVVLRVRPRRLAGSPPTSDPSMYNAMYSCVYHLNPNQQSIRNRTCAYYGPPMMLDLCSAVARGELARTLLALTLVVRCSPACLASSKLMRHSFAPPIQS